MHASALEPIVAFDHTSMLVPASQGDCLSSADPPLSLHTCVAPPGSWHGSPSRTSVAHAVVTPSTSLAGSFSPGMQLHHLQDLGQSAMHTAAGSACMVSTQPILHFLQAQTAMQPAGQPACISISPPNSTSTMPQQQLVLVQPQHSQMVLMQQQTVLQDPPGLLPAGLQQQKPRPHLWPLDDQILQQYRTSTLFYAGVLPIATDEGLLGVFEQFGTVVSLEQFKPYKDSKTSKGCGLVVFSTREEATCAMEALGGKFVWPGARSPIVIEWSSKHKRPKQQQQQPKQKKQVLPQAGQEASKGQGVAPAVPTAAVAASFQQVAGSCAMPQTLLPLQQQLQLQPQQVLFQQVQPQQQHVLLQQPQQHVLLQQPQQHVLVQQPQQLQQQMLAQQPQQQQQMLVQQPQQLQQQVLMQQPQQFQLLQQQQVMVLVPVTHVPLMTPYPMGTASTAAVTVPYSMGTASTAAVTVPYPMGTASTAAVTVSTSQPAMLVRF